MSEKTNSRSSRLITHHSSLFLTDRINCYRRVSLAVTLFALVVFASLLFENYDFRAASVVNHSCRNFRRANYRFIGPGAIARRQQRIQHNFLSCFRLNLMDTNLTALFHFNLLSACSDNFVCHLYVLSDESGRHRKVDYYRHLTPKRQPLTLTVADEVQSPSLSLP